MRRVMAMILAISFIGMNLVACGEAREEVSVNNTIETEAVMEGTVERETTEETKTIEETVVDSTGSIEGESSISESVDTLVNADVLSMDNVAIARSTSGIKVSEVGNYETYLDNINLKNNMLITLETENSIMQMAYSDNDVMLRLKFNMEDEGKSGIVDYALIKQEDSLYAITSFDTGDSDSTTVIDRADTNDGTEDIESDELLDEFDMGMDAKSDITYVEYKGEEDYEGVTYDVIVGAIESEDKSQNGNFYFTKDGEFKMMTFIDPSYGSICRVEVLDSLQLPDMSDYEIKEDTADNVAASLLGMMLTFAFSSMDSASVESDEDGYSLDDIKEEEVEVTGHSKFGSSVNFYGGYYEEGDTSYMITYKLSDEDGENFMKWKDEADENNQNLYLTIKYGKSADDEDYEYRVIEIIDHRFEDK